MRHDWFRKNTETIVEVDIKTPLVVNKWKKL